LPGHRVTSWGWASARGKILAGAWLGVLTYVVPADLVEEAVGDGLAWEMRLRSLPARVTVYFVLGLCLFTGTGYGGVFLQVTSGLGLVSPATTALSAARRRLGDKPLQALFGRLRSALSPGRAPWSHVAGLLVVAWDGTSITLADTAANAAAFGRPGSGAAKKNKHSAAAAPQARLVALVACGTRAVLDAAFGPCRGSGTGERALAGQLVGSLRAGLLLLADKGFYSYRLWNAAAGTGAALLWRVKDSMPLPVARQLPDGSWLAHVNDPAAVARRARRNGARRRRGSTLPPDTGPLPGITVRVIDYVVTVGHHDGSTQASRYRLITTLCDYRRYPAGMLAAAYARRWAIETGWREIKTYLRGTGRPLRGQTPDLARQELWALLAVYQALRVLITRAAAGAGIDPGRISFTAALGAARRSTTTARGQLPALLEAADAEMLAVLVPARPGRLYARAVKKIPFAAWPARDPTQAPIPHRATITATITPPNTATPTHHDQHKQPTTSTTQPP
jgi:hypothetical protein